jgi:hypothetical protein
MASRFWVGGSGDWDAATTTHWAATSGGAGGQSVPGSSDTVTFDASSGGGTVTRSVDVTVQSITCGAFTGTLDFSVHNKNATLTATTPWNSSGSGARTIKLGSGTYSLTSTSTTGGVVNRWNNNTVTNETFDGGTARIVLAAPVNGTVVFIGGGKTYDTVEFSAGAGGWLKLQDNNTIGTLVLNGPSIVQLNNGDTQTLTTLTVNSSASGLVELHSPEDNLKATISKASGSVSIAWCSLFGMTFSGGATFSAANSFDMGGNTGITITPPAAGGMLFIPDMAGT